MSQEKETVIDEILTAFFRGLMVIVLIGAMVAAPVFTGDNTYATGLVQGALAPAVLMGAKWFYQQDKMP